MIFRHDLIDGENAEYKVAAEQAYAVLNDSLVAVAEEVNPELDISMAATTCWAAMQGLIELYGTMKGREEDHGAPGPASELEIGDLAERVSRMLVDGFRPLPR